MLAKREPTNSKDKNAVGVYLEDVLVGYVPYNLAPRFSQFLQRDVNKAFVEVTGEKVNRAHALGGGAGRRARPYKRPTDSRPKCSSVSVQCVARWHHRQRRPRRKLSERRTHPPGQPSNRPKNAEVMSDQPVEMPKEAAAESGADLAWGWTRTRSSVYILTFMGRRPTFQR